MTDSTAPDGLTPTEAAAFVELRDESELGVNDTVLSALEELAERRRLGVAYTFRKAAWATRVLETEDDQRERLAMTPGTRAEAVRQLLDQALEDAESYPPGEGFPTKPIRELAAALATLEGLIPRVAIAQPEQAAELVLVHEAAERLLTAISNAGIQREHFAGRLEALLEPIEELDAAVHPQPEAQG